MTPRRTSILILTLAMTLAGARCFALDIKRVTLGNGATLLISEQHQLPMVTMAIAFDAGARRDPQGKGGLAQLTAQSLTEGTRDMAAKQVDEKTDFMGSSLAVEAGQDYANAQITTLKRYWPDTLHLLAAVLSQPGLRDADIMRKRSELIAGLNSQAEQPGYVAQVTFAKLLFGDRPYGHPPEGTPESVATLTPQDVRQFYKQYYRLGSAVIAVVGDVTAQEVKEAIEKGFTGIEGTVAPQAEPAKIEVAPGAHVTKIDRNITQANLTLGFGGVARSHPDYYRLQVMNYILGGGGFSSRLVREVRSKAGLAYSVGSQFESGKFQGSFQVVLQTKNASANQAIRMVLQQMRDIQNTAATDSEIDSAKKFLIGSFPLKIDRQSTIASFLLQIELYGLGLDYADKYPALIQSVSKEDVQRVARAYLRPDAYLLVAVANQSEAAINVASADQH
ncbi:MAG TPA: pitrilysin family protein [Candidatus Binataceae bacterium]